MSLKQLKISSKMDIDLWAFFGKGERNAKAQTAAWGNYHQYYTILVIYNIKYKNIQRTISHVYLNLYKLYYCTVSILYCR